jgi:diaminopimelate decarboxylase
MRQSIVPVQPEDILSGNSPESLAGTFATPLYIYSETVLRRRCREVKDMVRTLRWKPFYSMKANGNIRLLEIIRAEGFCCDTMSPGETVMAMRAGFSADELLFIPNNVSNDEFLHAAKRGITVSLDSLSQLERFGSILPGSRCAVRLNPGTGAGHHEKVITAGKAAKFGIGIDEIPALLERAARHSLRIVGINQHVGSLFTDPSPWLASCRSLLESAAFFPDLEWLDMGGGFGFSYARDDAYSRMDLAAAGAALESLCREVLGARAESLEFRCEPGRYIAAECGMLLGTVHALKENGGVNYCGTDIGMNHLMRPVLYGAYHEIIPFVKSVNAGKVHYRITGNICESGDLLGDRLLPELHEGDVFGVMDAGAYGYSMASSYNGRGRPAEVLIRENGRAELIRRRETVEDLLQLFV